MSNPLVMSESERQEFLAGVHVGVLSIPGGAGAPLQSPVWYEYEPGGDVVISMGAHSRKAELLAASGTASLCAQTESLPYKFVVVSGPVAIGPSEDPIRHRLARRYLPGQFAEDYIRGLGDGADSITVRLTPTTWRSNDFAKAF